MDLIVVAFRCLVSVIVGLVIGVERSKHGRAAGMRTHVLVCLGSAMTAMTGIYIHEAFGTGDVFRLSAQVISGVGFLGAGMIILKNDNVITGLTTAAGVWATSTLGIAVGFGFYTGALIATFLFLITLTLFVKFERRKKNMEVFYLEIDDIKCTNAVMDEIRALAGNDVVFRVLAAKSAQPGYMGIEVVLDRRKHLSPADICEIEHVLFTVEQ